MNTEIKTPETHPDHRTVGHHFCASSFSGDGPQIYFCDSYDPRIGFWMTNIYKPEDRKNVSERAIGRTFHEAEERENHWYVNGWNQQVPKPGASATLKQHLEEYEHEQKSVLHNQAEVPVR